MTFEETQFGQIAYYVLFTLLLSMPFAGIYSTFAPATIKARAMCLLAGIVSIHIVGFALGFIV